jgi:hypothetical protein
MITYARKTGRLVEIRIDGPYEKGRFGRVIALANELGPDAKVVVCSDMRKVAVLSAEQEQSLATVMRAHMERVELGVLLVGAREAQRRTANRVQGGTGSASVEVVRTVDEALALLGPLLNAAELARAKQFLAEGSE